VYFPDGREVLVWARDMWVDEGTVILTSSEHRVATFTLANIIGVVLSSPEAEGAES
jgi:hypothetical protein